jgi:hypothetical protein
LDEEFAQPNAEEVTDAIWRGIKEQIINEHASFNRPL